MLELQPATIKFNQAASNTISTFTHRFTATAKVGPVAKDLYLTTLFQIPSSFTYDSPSFQVKCNND